MNRKAITALGVAVIAILASGCAKKSEPDVGGEVGTISVAATDGGGEFAYEVDAEGVEGGIVNVDFSNNGEEAHDFQLIAATEGHTIEEVAASQADEEAPFEDWIIAAGGLGSTPSGSTDSATIALAPGTYWYFCTESSDVDGENVPHSTAGMLGELTLDGDNAAALPEADATVTASDYTFETEGLVAGTQTVLFENTGETSHHILAVPINEGATIEDVKSFISSEEADGPPPVDFEGMVATAVIGPGWKEVVSLDLEAATSYALVCFMPDPGTAGPPHAAKGMLVGLDIA